MSVQRKRGIITAMTGRAISQNSTSLWLFTEGMELKFMPLKKVADEYVIEEQQT